MLFRSSSTSTVPAHSPGNTASPTGWGNISRERKKSSADKKQMCIRDRTGGIEVDVIGHQRHAGTDSHCACGGMTFGPVSYTHLDVYKRQSQSLPSLQERRLDCRPFSGSFRRAYRPVYELYPADPSTQGPDRNGCQLPQTIGTVSYTHLPSPMPA